MIPLGSLNNRVIVHQLCMYVCMYVCTTDCFPEVIQYLREVHGIFCAIRFFFYIVHVEEELLLQWSKKEKKKQKDILVSPGRIELPALGFPEGYGLQVILVRMRPT